MELPKRGLNRARRRPPEEIERWVEEYADDVYRLAFTYLKSAHDADDMVQTVFLKALSKAPDFEDLTHERAWFVRVTANTCKDALRGRRRRPMAVGSSQDIADVADVQGRPAASDNASFVPREGAAPGPVTEAVFSLSADYREAVFLYYYEGYSVAEVAEILKLSQSAVKMRLKRGRELLKLELEGAI